MKKTIYFILSIVTLLIIIFELLQLLGVFISSISDISFSKFEEYAYLTLYFLLAFDAFFVRKRNNGFGLIFLLLAVLLLIDVLLLPFEFGLVIAVLYYMMNKSKAYIGLLIAFLGVALNEYLHEIVTQLFIIIGMYFYLIEVHSKYKLKRK